MQVTSKQFKTRKEAKQFAAEQESALWLTHPEQFEIRIEASLGSARAHGYIVKTIIR